MVEYKCNRCGYNAKQKINLMRHLNRKNICEPILEDISIEEVKFLYGFDFASKSPQKSSKSPQKSSKKSPQKSSKILKNASKSPQKSSKILNFEDCKECSYCFKRFSRIDNFKRHMKTCKKKNENENEKDKKIEELIKNQEEMKGIVEKLLLEKSNTNITNNMNNMNNSNNTTNNMTNNIIINNYGDEDTKYITTDYILNLLKYKPAKAIPELIKHTYFNEEHPENQNIKITNKKEPYIKVRKNNKWELQNKDETITDLIDRQQIYLIDETIEKKVEEGCSNIEKNNIKRCNKLYNDEDKEYMKRLYSESELVIINNS
tara:strand:+ start:162 stop:1115 length:954 start_codon:yes stop_codon:yes gene_type:complete